MLFYLVPRFLERPCRKAEMPKLLTEPPSSLSSSLMTSLLSDVWRRLLLDKADSSGLLVHITPFKGFQHRKGLFTLKQH